MAINERLIDTAVAAGGDGGDGFTEEVDGLILHLDANDVDSYDGDGDEWVDISTFNINPNTLTQAPPALSSPTPLISYATNDANSYIGTTTWKNLSSATYNASLGGATFSEADGSSLYFDDSTNDSVTTTYSSTSVSAVTWEGWFKLDQVGNNESIGSFSVNGGNVVIFAQSTSTNTPQGTFDYVYVKHADLVGDWVHIAIKFTGWAGSYSTSAYGAGISAQVYINGSSTGTVTVTPYGQTSTHNTIFRVMGNTTTYRAKGLLSEFRFYESGLSDTDVLANYNHGRVKFNELETADLALHLDAASFDGSTNTPTTWTALTGSNGTISGASFDSELGNWLDFDGSNDYVSIPSTATSPIDASARNFTFSMWINRDSTGYAPLITKYGTNTNTRSWYFQVDTSGRLQMGWWNGSSIVYKTATSAIVNTTSQWYHVALSVNASTMDFYVDGVLKDSLTGSVTHRGGGNEPIIIGSQASGNYNFFNGKIGQVRLYDSALTSNQIKGNYLSTANLYPNGFDGTLGTGSTKPTWNSGGYFDFDGSNDKITLPNTMLSMFDVSNRTMSMWFWTDNQSSGTQIPFTIKGADLDFGLMSVEITNSSNTLKLQVGYGSVTNSLTMDAWNHIAIVQQDASYEGFLNGTSIGTSGSAKNTFSGTDFILGQYSGGSYPFNGRISNLKLYSRALTGTEITALHTAGR